MSFKKGSVINLGRKATEETKENQRQARKGLRPSRWGAGFKPGNIPWNKGESVARCAYYAGLIDADGHIAIQDNLVTKGRYGRVVVKVTQATKEALIDGYDKWGGFLLTRHRNGNIYYEWVLQHGYAEQVLRNIRPFLKLKRDQADLALQFRYIQTRKRSVRKITDEEMEIRKKIRQDLKDLHLNKGTHSKT